MKTLPVTLASAACAAATLVLLAMTGCGAGHAKAAPPQGKVATPPELKSIAELRSVFDHHSGEPRLIVLTSPT